ncbi:MAG: hypothetical protein HN778_01990 [Prolixibacteraceae bacterium]|jgi:cysteinyl-tRNA synthetase, unknown class|nr:hypothetical protein [Prolixibacteraceae bacterium]MBT6006156.1 hypothetical protein [Prolixibacteraceae bacterium]MBT6766875.1 hypothetical protein [Prolixibacteraceae bacterium]MBT6999935.1 hypothetical protein [Prolixibacteraceae bacterium]MBT7393581.1 hypothetical protein [Prolixibacteraceae bacterium]
MKNLIFVATIFMLLMSCEKDDNDFSDGIDFKQEMRDFVIGISNSAKSINPGFIIIPQNGIELVTISGEENAMPDTAYLNAIDGNGQEDLLYGYDNDNEATPTNETEYLLSFLEISMNSGNTILVTDYCSTPSKIDNSYTQNSNKKFISFAADQRELNNIPNYPSPIFRNNNDNINSLEEVKNFLYLINPEKFSTKAIFVDAVTSTNYDLLIMDLFFIDGTEFSLAEINQLKNKFNGGKRLVICYLSVGEAENYRYYWQESWNINNPSWLGDENPEWKENFKVKFWQNEWQDIIYGNENSYLKKIINSGFDGVYLDIIDAFEYYETASR